MMSLLACQRVSPSGSGTRGGQRSIALRFIAMSISMYSLVVVMLTCPSQDLITLSSAPDWSSDLPRTFRTADLWLIHAADCRSRYSSWTCRGVRYCSPECLRFELYQNSMYLTTSRRACSRVGYWVR